MSSPRASTRSDVGGTVVNCHFGGCVAILYVFFVAVATVVFVRSVMIVSLFFFFQAEDGIRDLIVTGVQTCALPIWLIMSGYADRKEGFKGVHDHIYARAIVLGDGSRLATLVAWELIGVPDPVWEEQIGRASCRERV